MTSPWGVKATAGGGGERSLPEAGTHPAVLVALVDLGTHEETFTDKEKGTSRTVDMRKVYLAWELTTQPVAGQPGANHVLCRDYNVSFGEKAALRLLMERWRGKKFEQDEDFDLSGILGKPCLLTVVYGRSKNTGSEYAKLDSVGPVMKGVNVPKPRRVPFAWRVGDPAESLPDWLPYLYGEPVKDVIARSNEAKGGAAGVAAAADAGGAPAGSEEEVPF